MFLNLIKLYMLYSKDQSKFDEDTNTITGETEVNNTSLCNFYTYRMHKLTRITIM